MDNRAFWQLSDDERRSIPTTLVGEQEEHAFYKINEGRRWVKNCQEPDVAYPGSVDLEPLTQETEVCDYYDAVASILMAALQDGHDPVAICLAAIDQQAD